MQTDAGSRADLDQVSHEGIVCNILLGVKCTEEKERSQALLSIQQRPSDL